MIEYGLRVMVLGMTVVLSTLALLALLMRFMEAVFYKPTPVPSTPASPNFQPDISDEELDDLATIAVLSAAIAAYLGRPIGSFNVISIERQEPSSWQTIGRRELLDTSLIRKL